MGSIRLHPEHGVNPTVSACFFCNKDKNEIALLGAAYKGEAPRRMVLDYIPCDECKADMARGIALIECTCSPNTPDQPVIQEGLYPTGKWAVITEDAAWRWFQPESVVAQVLKHRKAFVEPGVIPKEPANDQGGN
jgi:hypothetical protein